MKVSRYTNIVYIGKYIRIMLVLTYVERLFSAVCCFFSSICQSENCMSWVSKFYNFFLTCSEADKRFIFEGLKYCPLWKVHLQHSVTFIAFYIWSVNCSRDFSVAWLVSNLFELSLSVMSHISEIFTSLNINSYLRPCNIATYGKFHWYCLYL